MKRLAIPSLIFLLLSGICFAQTTYVQTTRTCQPVLCNNAQFNPSATLSYGLTDCKLMGCSFANDVAIWKEVSYYDFTGKMLWLGYGNHYPYGAWRIQGTFDGGVYSVAEDFECYRTCGTRSNVSGIVVGP